MAPAADAEPQAAAERAAALRQANPLYIPRNHLVEEALVAASDHGDMGPTLALLDVLRQPFTERAGLERYTLPAAPEVAQGIGPSAAPKNLFTIFLLGSLVQH